MPYQPTFSPNSRDARISPIPDVTDTAAGLMTPEQKAKLDSLPVGGMLAGNVVGPATNNTVVRIQDIPLDLAGHAANQVLALDPSNTKIVPVNSVSSSPESNFALNITFATDVSPQYVGADFIPLTTSSGLPGRRVNAPISFSKIGVSVQPITPLPVGNTLTVQGLISTDDGATYNTFGSPATITGSLTIDDVSFPTENLPAKSLHGIILTLTGPFYLFKGMVSVTLS